MAKKKIDQRLPEDPEFNSSEAYKLKKDAVNRLVNASKETAPKVTEEEIEKYRGKKKFQIPNVLVVLFIKWWFAGAICFFIYFGLGTVIGDPLDLLFVFGVALGAFTDLLTNHFLRFIAKDDDSKNDKFIMVTVRKFWSFFVNIPYAFLVLVCVMYIYKLIELLLGIMAQSFGWDNIKFGVEPLLFGLVYLGVDMLFILMKNTAVKIFKDAKEKSRR